MFKKRFLVLITILSIVICNTVLAEQKHQIETYQKGEEIEEGVFLFSKTIKKDAHEAISICKMIIPASQAQVDYLRDAIECWEAAGGEKGSTTLTVDENDPTGSFSATLSTTYYTTTVSGYACAKLTGASIFIDGYGSSGNYMGSGLYLNSQNLTAGTTGIHPTSGTETQVGYASRTGSVRSWSYSAPSSWVVVKKVDDGLTAIGASLKLSYHRGTSSVIKSFTIVCNLVG